MALAGLLRVDEAQLQLAELKKKFPNQNAVFEHLQNDINAATKYKAAQK